MKTKNNGTYLFYKFQIQNIITHVTTQIKQTLGIGKMKQFCHGRAPFVSRVFILQLLDILHIHVQFFHVKNTCIAGIFRAT